MSRCETTTAVLLWPPAGFGGYGPCVSFAYAVRARVSKLESASSLVEVILEPWRAVCWLDFGGALRHAFYTLGLRFGAGGLCVG